MPFASGAFRTRAEAASLAATEPVRDLVAAVDGAQEVDERLQLWRAAIEMVNRGWLRRSIYWATAR